jgi:hypothetical protein
LSVSTVVLVVVAIAFFAAVVIALLFVSREGGGWRFGFKLGNYFSGGASGSGRGASITKSKSTHGGATAKDFSGHAASISETEAKGELIAEVSEAGSDPKKKT